jgi:hypothetical protein
LRKKLLPDGLGQDGGCGLFLLLPPDAAQRERRKPGLTLSLHGVVFVIFVLALPGTAETTFCRVRDRFSGVAAGPAPKTKNMLIFRIF